LNTEESTSTSISTKVLEFVCFQGINSGEHGLILETYRLSASKDVYAIVIWHHNVTLLVLGEFVILYSCILTLFGSLALCCRVVICVIGLP